VLTVGNKIQGDSPWHM